MASDQWNGWLVKLDMSQLMRVIILTNCPVAIGGYAIVSFFLSLCDF